MKDVLTFLGDLDDVLSKHYGEGWNWKTEKLEGGFEILLTIDEGDEDIALEVN